MMVPRRSTLHRTALSAMTVLAAAQVSAQHGDILLQDVGGQLTLGSANLEESAFELGARVFAAVLSSSLTTDEPGWNALPGGSPLLPPGAGGLPGERDLTWDFLPMTTTGGISTLLYWTADGEDAASVDFAPAPLPGTSLSLFGVGGEAGVADGAAEATPGTIIDRTDADGALHRHRYFFLDDGDDQPATMPPGGIYLTALQLRMEGLEASDPFYLLFATPDVSYAALEEMAEPWVDARVDQLACLGECPSQLVVDLAVWQRRYGLLEAATSADGDRDGDSDVDGADFLAIQASRQAGPAVLAVPEPATILTHALGFLLAWTYFRRRPGCKEG